ncbi:hypothetical protein [uncultured Tateyamaria sp.]|uniref:hypothetical protein n=1 Tax=uncultured Tateyamaria sp. TaxID=455651 RepID=UPI00262B879E|nr:hypothetical protein [uncultured Tateyamaria sp.]
MIAKTKISPRGGRICESRIKYVKMKYEVNEGSQPLGEPNVIHPAASVDQREAPSRADGNHAHPVISDEETRTPKTSVGKESATMTEYNDVTVEDESKLSDALDAALEKAPMKSVGIDVEKYQAYLDDPDLSDEEREQLVLLIWQIMMAFVDLGFGVHPVQQACGQVPESVDETGNRDSSMLSSSSTTLSDTFNHIAAE